MPLPTVLATQTPDVRTHLCLTAMTSMWQAREYYGVWDFVNFSMFIRTPWVELPRSQQCQGTLAGQPVSTPDYSMAANFWGTPVETWLWIQKHVHCGLLPPSGPDAYRPDNPETPRITEADLALITTAQLAYDEFVTSHPGGLVAGDNVTAPFDEAHYQWVQQWRETQAAGRKHIRRFAKRGKGNYHRGRRVVVSRQRSRKYGKPGKTPRQIPLRTPPQAKIKPPRPSHAPVVTRGRTVVSTRRRVRRKA